VIKALLVAGNLNDTVLEIRTWDQAAVETGGIKQDQIDRLKGENRVVESASNAAPTAAHS
jgi:hypothetical protein